MSKMYDSLMTGLEEALDDAQGKICLHRKKVKINPIKEYSPVEIRQIRMNAGFSQSTMAAYMGISKKTIEAWESGRNVPNGTARRLLEIISEEKEVPFFKSI